MLTLRNAQRKRADMKPYPMRIFFAALILLTAASCRQAAIYDVDKMALNAPTTATLAEVEAAIKRAGAGLGWHIKTVSPGHLEARLPIRTHLAVTDIRHDTQTFSINYKTSTNLNYNADNRTIHSNYVSWIHNLENAILAQTSTL